MIDPALQEVLVGVSLAATVAWLFVRVVGRRNAAPSCSKCARGVPPEPRKTSVRRLPVLRNDP